MNENEGINRRVIQWFPGHMTKTLRLMEVEIKNVDCVLQILDARIPLSSLNPELERITASKPHLYLLNKADLADPAITKQWLHYFQSAGAGCLAMDSKQRGGAGAVKAPIERELSALLARRRNRGMVGARIHVMVVGIPNVGKSTFINNLAGSARAKAANRPGVTRGKQWITVDEFDLMDMPGVLWKKFDSLEVATHLAFIGSIKDDILDIEELACGLLSSVRSIYPTQLLERYKLGEDALALPPYDLLQAIARKRGMLVSGGEADTERAATMLVGEFRASKWGRISLERPPQRQPEADFDGEEGEDVAQDDD
ncbi:MAG: ribosome biogenesis GTPase YlqF [Gemmiger sp.]|nr:ribosome biogenesis GTPase YlqF [Gemmiger sp.]